VQVITKYEGFRWLWIGQLLSQLGTAVFLVMGLWEIQLRSPFLLSIAGLAMMIPSSLAVFGGVIVDRYDPGRLMLWTDVLRGLALGLGVAALYIHGALMAAIIILLGINSLGGSLFSPAEGVLVPRLVADGDLPAANGLYSVTYQLAEALGSAIGGAAIAALGAALVFGIDMGSFWLSALFLWLMIRSLRHAAPTPADTAAPDAQSEGREPAVPFLSQLREGLVALRRLPVVLKVLPVVVLANFAYVAAFTMLPFWIRHSLHTTVLWYGLVSAAWAAGLVLGSLGAGLAGRWSMRRGTAATFAVQALFTGVFAVVRIPGLAALDLLVAGIGNGVANALTLTLMQRLVPEELRGRVFGLTMTLFTVANPLGTLAAGFLLHVLPLWWAWAFSAVVGAVMAVDLYLAIPEDIDELAGSDTSVQSQTASP
jgi:DHA3 family macrolide efflux protein-like MFS transporter